MVDNYSQWKQHEAEAEKWLRELPLCSECYRPIQDERCFEFNGEIICEECLADNHKKWTEDYIE